MKYFLLASLSVLICFGCGSEDPYTIAREEASKQPPNKEAIGVKLRFGMSEKQVNRILDSLRAEDKLVFGFSPGSLHLRPNPVARYLNGRLAFFAMQLAGYAKPDMADLREFDNQLSYVYGPGYSHGGGSAPARSWFNGSTEVEMLALPNGDYSVVYVDLTKWPQLARADSLHNIQKQ